MIWAAKPFLGCACIILAPGCEPRRTVESPAPDAAPTLPAEGSYSVHQMAAPMTGRELSLTLIRFRASDVALVVIDNGAHADRPRFRNLQEALQSQRCLAGTNGGFFDQQTFAPSGLLVSDGKIIQPLDRGHWGGGVLAAKGGELLLAEQQEFALTANVSQAIQAGPWLVKNAQPESGFQNDDRAARRTFVATDGAGLWILGYAEPCTLGELATILRSSALGGLLHVKEALNLDGGPSSAVAIRWPTGLAAEVESVSTVRDFLGVRARDSNR